MPANAARIHARSVSAAFVGSGHVALFVLALTHHLAFTAPSEFQLLVMLGTDNLWLVVHLVCAVVIAIALVRPRFLTQALSLSAGWMGAWGFFALLTALTAIRPVSFAGPLLAIVLAGVAYNAAMPPPTVSGPGSGAS